ncbi:MAG: DNA mismatch repair protein MutS [Azospirillum sp.]|nr:DNA mismatch repair protein MutS [Azospirillum sp.]
MSGSPSHPRRPTEEESALWREAMRDAKPLRRPEAPAELPPVRAETMADLMGPPPPGGLPEPVPAPARAGPVARPRTAAKPEPPPLAPGHPAGLDRRTHDRLHRGRLEIEARIDLHGLTQAQAHTALSAFIHRCWREQCRCVLVITGKGGRATDDRSGGILRAAVPRWLGEPVLRTMVLAIDHARPRDGGDGALYVLLKRHRAGPKPAAG